MAVMRQVNGGCRDCQDSDRVYRQYLRACRWIEQSKEIFPKRVLSNQRESIEARAPVEQGGDGTLSLGKITRSRRDIINVARSRGWKDPGESPAEPTTALSIRPSCPASEAIRKTAYHTDHAYLVGKGPSLDELTAADFDDHEAPVLATNEAVLVVEKLGIPNPVFGIQQDARLKKRARPEHAYWLLSRQAWRKGDGDSHPGAVRYEPEAIGGTIKSLTANQALRILGIAGFHRVTMVAFDACVTGDCRYAEAVNANTDEWNQKPNRFTGYCREIRRVAQHEGARLAFTPPHGQWDVVCVMRSGGRYSHAHADWLRRQVSQRLVTPHKFWCLTDNSRREWHLPLAHSWPGWWSKPELFRPGQFGGGVMYLDLDVVLPRSFELPAWDALEAGVLYARPDFMRDGEINSSVMLWRGDACSDIYHRMVAEADTVMSDYRRHGDQQFEGDVMAGRIRDLPIEVKSWKVDRPAPESCDVIVFHGDPKPWDMQEKWIPALQSKGATRWDFLSGLISQNGYDTIAEIGTKDGRTSEAILAQCDCVRRLYSIDMFQPQVETGEPGAENYNHWNWDKIIVNYRTRLQPYRDRCVTLIMDAIEAATLVPDGLGLAFLDADHREGPTREAIRAWKQKLRTGGILAGHDIDWPSVRAAVQGELPGYQVGPDSVWYCEV